MNNYNGYSQGSRGTYNPRRGGRRPRPYQSGYDSGYNRSPYHETEQDHLPTGYSTADKVENWKKHLDNNWTFKVVTPRVDGIPNISTLVPRLNEMAVTMTEQFKDEIKKHLDTCTQMDGQQSSLIENVLKVMQQLQQQQKTNETAD
jgi:hypothetical protein